MSAIAFCRRQLTDALHGSPPPRLLVLSRFGLDFLPAGAESGPRIEIALPQRKARWLGRSATVAGVPLLALELEDSSEATAFDEALPLFVAAPLDLAAVVSFSAGAALVPKVPAPSLVAIADWIRSTNEDPLRELEGSVLGARFPELRHLRHERPLQIAAEQLAAEGGTAPVVALARRGPSGATDAELEVYARLGAELLIEGCAAEVVAARHQGIPYVALALVLDSLVTDSPADPGQLAEAAALLLPRCTALIEELVPRLMAEARR